MKRLEQQAPVDQLGQTGGETAIDTQIEVDLICGGVGFDDVDELALSNQKRIEPKMKESLIDIAVRQYHVSVSDASVYINH